jgi:hypothetical protein
VNPRCPSARVSPSKQNGTAEKLSASRCIVSRDLRMAVASFREVSVYVANAYVRMNEPGIVWGPISIGPSKVSSNGTPSAIPLPAVGGICIYNRLFPVSVVEMASHVPEPAVSTPKLVNRPCPRHYFSMLPSPCAHHSANRCELPPLSSPP